MNAPRRCRLPLKLRMNSGWTMKLKTFLSFRFRPEFVWACGSWCQGAIPESRRLPMNVGRKAVLKPPHSKRWRDGCAARGLAERLECAHLQRRFSGVAAQLQAPARRGFARGEMNHRERLGRL